VEDVYRFQEVESDDEKNSILPHPGAQRLPTGAQHSNPDELYFNDMDLGAWERRAVDGDGMAYGEDHRYLEDEGYYDDAGDFMSSADYEELLYQRVMDKIRLARATGDADVRLSPDELEAYQGRSSRMAPAAHPQARFRPANADTANVGTTAVAPSHDLAAGPTARKRNQRRTSMFSSKAKDKKPIGRSHGPSNEMASQQPPPGFVVPGSNGQHMFAPINAYQGRMVHDTHPAGPLANSRPSTNPAQARGFGLRPTQTPTRITPPGDMPGTFPGSPLSHRGPSPVYTTRPASSSSSNRTRSSPNQQSPKLIPFPTPEYKHHTPEPFQYQVAGQLASSSSSTASQAQYARRVSPGNVDGSHANMPRRVPVPVQRVAATATQGVHGSYSDSVLTQKGLRAEGSEEDEERGDRRASWGKKKKSGRSRRKN
jgi:hypothetical protein